MLARQFAQPADELLDELQRAYADEWFGHYNYFFVSTMITGASAVSVAALLRRKSDEAFSRAQRLAGRLIQLGSGPVPKLTQLIDHATDKPFPLPDDLSDVAGMLKAVLDAERTSIRTHQRIYTRTRDLDPMTATLAVELMTEAVRGEQELERLLAQPAPEMTGLPKPA